MCTHFNFYCNFFSFLLAYLVSFNNFCLIYFVCFYVSSAVFTTILLELFVFLLIQCFIFLNKAFSYFYLNLVFYLS